MLTKCWFCTKCGTTIQQPEKPRFCVNAECDGTAAVIGETQCVE